MITKAGVGHSASSAGWHTSVYYPVRHLAIIVLLLYQSTIDAWRVEVFDARVGAEIEALPTDIRAKLAHIVEMMTAVGPQRMREPHVKPLGDKLWEMRMSGRDGIARAIYILATGRRIVILHAFVKKSQKTPQGAIRLAEKRAKELSS